MANVLKAGDGGLWVQKTSGGVMEYIGCLDIDPIVEPAGDVTLIKCRQPDRTFKTVASSQAAPGPVTTSIKANLFPGKDILDELKSCPANYYVTSQACGKLDVFHNYDRIWAIAQARISSRAFDNLVAKEGDDAIVRTLDLQAEALYKARTLKVSTESIAETAALNDIAICSDEVCGGDCGAAADAGQDLVSVGDTPAGSPATLPDVWHSHDGGTIWVMDPGGAHPFAAAQDIMSIVCFELDRNTTRWLVVREQVAGAHLTVAYSDDGGASWTSVEVHDVDNEGAMGQGALFALDKYHIWLCTSAGNVFFSDDGGETWTDLAASSASGAQALYQVHFCADGDNGYAVGAADTIIQSTDGGETWVAITAPTTGKTLRTVQAFSRYRLIIGGSGDSLYQSWDEGDNWTSLSFTGKSTTGTVNAIEFINDLVGFMVHNTAAPVGSVHRTLNGGHDWQKFDNPATNAGLNAVAVVDENLAHAVGEASGGTAIAYKIAG